MGRSNSRPLRSARRNRIHLCFLLLTISELSKKNKRPKASSERSCRNGPILTATQTQSHTGGQHMGTAKQATGHAAYKCSTNGSSIDFWCQVQGQAQREPVCHVEPPSRLAVRGVRRVVDFNGQIIETARDDAPDEELSWQGPLFIGQSQKVVHPFLRECSTLVVKRNHVVVSGKCVCKLVHQSQSSF